MKKVFVMLLLFFSNIVLTQNIDFNFNYSLFNYDSNSVYLEAYYSFGQNSLTIVEENGEKFYKAILNLEIQNKVDNSTYLNKDWSIVFPVNNTENGNKNILGTLSIVLPEGDYILKATGSDIKNKDVQRAITFEVKAESFNGNKKFSISDIQLASNISKSENKNSIFYKNTFEVIPNPLSVFSEKKPVMYYYFELYNFTNSDNYKNLILEKKLVNSKNKVLLSKNKIVKTNFSSSVDVGVINLKKYPSDKYHYEISLLDDAKNILASSQKEFYLINPSVIDSEQVQIYNTAFLTSEFGIMEEKELDDHFDLAKYIATDQEKDQYEELDSINAKRKFLFNFWVKRDDQPETPQLELLEKYKSLVDYANLNFRTLGKKGYRTDRGRVYLIYGKPDQIERYTSDSELKPYVIWYYHSIEGGVNFIFGDIKGYSDYNLLHSSKRGEVYDQNWMNRLKVSN